MNTGTIFFLCVFALLTFIYLVERQSCFAYETITGKNVVWDFWAGCYIQASNGEWYTRDQYQNILIAKEGLKND